MKILLTYAAIATAIGTFGLASSTQAGVSLSGAGASFPAPIYQRWAQDFNAKTGVQVSYQSVGSGSGVKQFIAETVDFGASDAAMDDKELAEVKRGAVMLPMTAGSIVLAYNAPVEGLKLPRAVYPKIFLGEITNWNDPAIAAANPGVTLPDMPISVCFRSDGSGTTFVFTKHLVAISPDFDKEVGEGKSVTWPVGVGGKGNEGVTALVKQMPGSIGYVEYGYAKGEGLKMASIENKSGTFVAPTDESGAQTLSHVEFPENFRVWPADPTGTDDYPIATFTWMLLYKSYPDAAKLKALKDFVEFGLTDGQKIASELGYIPLPEAVVTKVRNALATVK